MESYIPGQRWIVEAEPELGLGLLVVSDERSVQLVFPASGETRRYAADARVLKRVRFRVQDRVQGHSTEPFQVEEVIERQGLITYRGGAAKFQRATWTTSSASAPRMRAWRRGWSTKALFSICAGTP